MKLLATILAALLTGGVAAAPATSSARDRVEPNATFWMTLTGSERTSWKVDYEAEGLGRCQGEGSEVVSFATDKRQKLTVEVLRHGALWVSYSFPSHSWGFPVAADLQRTADWPSAAGCLGGPSPEEATSCSRSIQVPWALEFLLTPLSRGHDRNHVFLHESNYRLAPDNSYDSNFDPFPGCWLEGNQFPSLVYSDATGRAFGAPLSSRQLLHSQRRLLTTTAHGSITEGLGASTTATTEVEWTLRLQRIARKG